MASAPLIRIATIADVPVLAALVEQSARMLSRGYYSDVQTAAAIAHVFGVDSELVADETYFVAEVNGRLAGCGGWSRRTTLFGGDNYGGRTSGFLEPPGDAAKIRAFFVSPAFARRGIGSAILDACEAAAKLAGFMQVELMATLPGVPFYEARHFAAGARIHLNLGGVEVDFVPMTKALR